MIDVETAPSPVPQTVGDQLRAMREKAGLDLNDIGTRTRIPMRHLAAIERGDYAALPSSTYSIGFTRAYARAVGGDEPALIEDLRVELGQAPMAGRGHEPHELTDPARVPSRLLAWTAAGLAALVALTYGGWRSGYFDGDQAVLAGAAAPVSIEAPSDVAPEPVPAVVANGGQVVLNAKTPVWLRVSTSDGKRLIEREMAAGEAWSVPGDAQDPRILTGRPDALRVTIDGRDVAALGPPRKTIENVAISAEALAARATPVMIQGE